MSGNIDAKLDLLLILSNFASNLRENTAVFSRKVGMKSRNRGQPNDNSFFRFFLVSYVGEWPWWPIQSPSKGRNKKVNG